MIARYRLLAGRIRTELVGLGKVVEQAQGAIARAEQQPDNAAYFIAAAAFELHSLYAGIERVFELIASDVDNNRPQGSNWHRDLLAQMTLTVPKIRPAVIRTQTQIGLLDLLEFRHVVRHMYTFNLRRDRVIELVADAQPMFELLRSDLTTFARFLDDLSAADE